MAKIPLPERGQPLDVTYIYQLAETINDVATQVSSATYKNSTVDTISAGKQNLKTSELKIVAGLVEVAKDSNFNAGNEISFSYDYNNFKFAPIVTASLVDVGNTSAGKNVTLVLKNPTETRVEGVVRFGESGIVSLRVNIIAIGISN
jgi:hypothetical protein